MSSFDDPSSREELLRSGKLLGCLLQAGIDAAPVTDDQGNHTGELVLFFEDDKFMIRVDARVPIVWLKGVHSKEQMKIPPIDPLFPYWYIEVFAPHEGAISAKECDDAWAALHQEFFELKAAVGKK